MQDKKWIIGLWKFSANISKEKLVKLAEKWAVESNNYLQLYVRKVSKDQNGIGFTYQLPDDANVEKAQDEYFKKTSDYLKRNFGNDLVGWDMASSVIIVK